MFIAILRILWIVSIDNLFFHKLAVNSNVKVYEYLEYILEKVDASMSEDELRKLLSYSPSLPERLKVRK